MCIVQSSNKIETLFQVLTLNASQMSNNGSLKKKKPPKVSPIVKQSKTIIRPDRPNIRIRRQDSESEDEDTPKALTDHSDLMESVLGKFYFNYVTVT